jgi:hypothetical protein
VLLPVHLSILCEMRHYTMHTIEYCHMDMLVNLVDLL